MCKTSRNLPDRIIIMVTPGHRRMVWRFQSSMAAKAVEGLLSSCICRDTNPVPSQHMTWKKVSNSFGIFTILPFHSAPLQTDLASFT